MYDVITIGSATLDVFLQCDALESLTIDDQHKLAFPYGSKLNVDDALFESGGGGTNTATTYARQGLNVATIAKIGDDFPGAQVLERLAQEKIDTKLLITDPTETTDFSSIIWSPHKGSVILVNRGKGKLEVTDVKWDTLMTRWFHITSVEGNLDILHNVRSVCESTDADIKIAWNPGKREIHQRDIVFDLLSCIEMLILNRREVELLIDAPIDLQNSDDRRKITEAFSCRKMILTDGHHGSYFWNGQRWLHAGIFDVDRTEATGAGDAFSSAFIASMIKEKSEEECLKRASANAASVVTAASAKRGILKGEEYGEWMKKRIAIEKLSS